MNKYIYRQRKNASWDEKLRLVRVRVQTYGIISC